MTTIRQILSTNLRQTLRQIYYQQTYDKYIINKLTTNNNDKYIINKLTTNITTSIRQAYDKHYDKHTTSIRQTLHQYKAQKRLQNE